jgi:hypothetical protein
MSEYPGRRKSLRYVIVKRGGGGDKWVYDRSELAIYRDVRGLKFLKNIGSELPSWEDAWAYLRR